MNHMPSINIITNPLLFWRLKLKARFTKNSKSLSLYGGAYVKTSGQRYLYLSPEDKARMGVLAFGDNYVAPPRSFMERMKREFQAIGTRIKSWISARLHPNSAQVGSHMYKLSEKGSDLFVVDRSNPVPPKFAAKSKTFNNSYSIPLEKFGPTGNSGLEAKFRDLLKPLHKPSKSTSEESKSVLTEIGNMFAPKQAVRDPKAIIESIRKGRLANKVDIFDKATSRIFAPAPYSTYDSAHSKIDTDPKNFETLSPEQLDRWDKTATDRPEKTSSIAPLPSLDRKF